MRELQLQVFEPGDMLGTLSTTGKVAVFTVGEDGGLAPSDNRLFSGSFDRHTPIEELGLSVRPYNVCKREGLNLLGDLVDFYEEKGTVGLDELRNLGEKGRDEIVSRIHTYQGKGI